MRKDKASNTIAKSVEAKCKDAQWHASMIFIDVCGLGEERFVLQIS